LGLARNGLPRRPFPGEVGFSGVPPIGETRFVSSEMIVHVGPGVSPQALNAAAGRLGLTTIGSQNLALTGGTLVHFRLAGGRDVADAVRALEAENIGIAQPNYVFVFAQNPAAPSLPQKSDPSQYVVPKLHLNEAHKIATGANVQVAVIDSMVDASHPDLAGSIVGQFDAVTVTDKPDEHGTGMTGAIAAHRKLLGVAPRARIFAIHAFSPNAQSQQATSQAIVAGIDWAIGKGARIINMSFAGPYDPILQVYLKKAHEHGIVLVAAAGNAGPQSPPLYPAADENVIAVTAVDEHDKLLSVANQGPHIALAAPGVNVIEVGPRGTYNLTTGTSVASAHVSGVAALILERNPKIDVATLENVLYSTAKDLGAPGRDSEYGYGLVDPYRALEAAEAPDLKVANAAPPKQAAADGPVMPVVATAAPDKSRFAPRRAPAPASVATEAVPPSVAIPPETELSVAPPPEAAPTETAQPVTAQPATAPPVTAPPETAHANPPPRAPKRAATPPASASKPPPAKVVANPNGPLDSTDLPNMTPPQPPQSAPHAPSTVPYAPPGAAYAPPSAAYPPPGAQYAPPSAAYAPPGGPYAPPSPAYAPPNALPMGPNAPVAPPYPARGMAPGPEAEDLAAIIVRKRLACRNDGFSRGVRGPDMLEYIASCVAEARLACARQVVAQRVRPYDRREFMSRCLLGVTAADAGR
jgi:subtilisin family serine protease